MIYGRIEWIKGRNAAYRIEDFLNEVNEDFIPSLSSRVNIAEYAVKLAEYADTVFVVDNYGKDIASCSIYCNQKRAYISSIAVMKVYRGIGVGHILMEEILRHTANLCEAIALHVHRENAIAIDYYMKHNFVYGDTNDLWIEMVYHYGGNYGKMQNA